METSIFVLLFRLKYIKISFSIQREAYVASLIFFDGLNVLIALINVAVIPEGEIKYEVHTVAPTLDTVRPIGGFRTLPDYSFENMPKDYAALVLIGGNRWDSPEAVKDVMTDIIENKF